MCVSERLWIRSTCRRSSVTEDRVHSLAFEFGAILELHRARDSYGAPDLDCIKIGDFV